MIKDFAFLISNRFRKIKNISSSVVYNGGIYTSYIVLVHSDNSLICRIELNKHINVSIYSKFSARYLVIDYNNIVCIDEFVGNILRNRYYRDFYKDF